MDRLAELKIRYNEAMEKMRMLRNEVNTSDEEKEKILKNFINENKELYREIRELSAEKENRITDVIKLIRQKYHEKTGGDASATYTEGGCYYFPIMIKNILPEEDIQTYICSGGLETHALVKINNIFYDINGNIDNPIGDSLDIKKIDTSDYKKATEEDYEYFRDLCYIGRNKENMDIFERISDEISEEIYAEMVENSVKNAKVA